ncbi:Cytochrome P450 [Dillenia turbinata]|uniref:Cytochrome P450 n=1 Tax=Dillenia turbinata TaxID=194707 RepID=A0AAN8W250_9MAGN
MELPWNVIVWCIICFFPVLIYLLRHRRPANFPPGPPGWPLIGNMFDVGNMPHRNLAALKQKYGPVVGLQLGAIRTMVILTPTAATEFFKNHDLNFVERTIIDTMKVHDFDKNSMSLASYGPSWRALRRLTTLDMLVAKRINESAPIRRKCADQMLAWLEEEARQNRTVEVARFTFLTTFNSLGNLMLSSDLLDPNCKEGAEFFEAMMGLMEWSGHPNLSDIFPFLKPFDLQGLRRNMHRDVGNALKIASRFVKKRVEERQKGVQTDRPKDFLDVLLEFEGDPKEGITKISEHTINVFIMEIFLAGSETTSSTTEWVMTELICNPEAMSKISKISAYFS